MINTCAVWYVVIFADLGEVFGASLAPPGLCPAATLYVRWKFSTTSYCQQLLQAPELLRPPAGIPEEAQ